VAIGNKGLGFLNRIGAKVVSHVTQLGDTPHLDKLIGPVKVLLDAVRRRQAQRGVPGYTRFINTMKQESVLEQLLPLSAEKMQADARQRQAAGWDYIYEPDAQTVIDDLLVRYVEALVYQAVAENMASEQSARMVAMKAATDNAGNVIAELKLVYNKTRQAAITKELSEIVAGAAAATPFTHESSYWSKKWLKFKARSFSVSAPWWTWSSRATRCPRCTTRSRWKARR
jgi:F-type H+-transporting ATPase subunit gamma